MANENVKEKTENASNQEETQASEEKNNEQQQPAENEQQQPAENKQHEQGEQQPDENKQQPAENEQGEQQSDENKQGEQGRLHKIAENVARAQDILSKIMVSVALAREVMDKLEPILDKKDAFKPVHEVLDTVEKRARTGQNLLDRVAPLIKQEGRVGAALTILSKVNEKIDEIQATMGKMTNGIGFIKKFSGLVGKKDEVGLVHNVLQKITAAIGVVKDLIQKIIELIKRTGQLPKQLVQTAKGTIDKVKGKVKAPADQLAALKNADIIKGGAAHKKEKEQAPSQPSEGWGVIGNSSHLVLVWSGR